MASVPPRTASNLAHSNATAKSNPQPTAWDDILDSVHSIRLLFLWQITSRTNPARATASRSLLLPHLRRSLIDDLPWYAQNSLRSVLCLVIRSPLRHRAPAIVKSRQPPLDSTPKFCRRHR